MSLHLDCCVRCALLIRSDKVSVLGVSFTYDFYSDRETRSMSTFSGLEGYTMSGNVGVAVIPGVGGNLAIQNFQTNAETSELSAVLAINGNLSKRTVDLGVLPQTSGSFSLAFDNDVDISLFNVLVIKQSDQAIGKAEIA